MRKLINAPESMVDEMLQGIYAAHPDQVRYVSGDLRCLVSAHVKKGKVGIATGGGSGHLPLFLGYVGEGMLDGCCVGGVFQSPSAMQMLEVTKAIDSGAGVLYIYGNYGGDVMNFDMAAEMAGAEGIRVEQVLGAEDVASAPKGNEGKRRGVAGIFYMYKIAGALAAEMVALEQVKSVAQTVAANVRTMGVALSACTIPEAGKPTFEIEEEKMEIGMGIHGEPGVRKGPLVAADRIVDEMLESILPDLPYQRGDEVSVLINGLGATPKEELYVFFRRVAESLSKSGIHIYHPYIGEFATSMEMAGASISLLKLDAELKRLLDSPANTPFFVQR
ncbi:MAG: dihydroxyacetone kinase subunit DhaK [Candidatus Sumerlaeota bacterium]|nr:dihydroxyacetone kinase subunit DhaK [Candidatus Sumerlaeota bacterium]